MNSFLFLLYCIYAVCMYEKRGKYSQGFLNLQKSLMCSEKSVGLEEAANHISFIVVLAIKNI